jgi:hypothetical protein
MARTDLTGLLTGVTQAPIDPMGGLTYEQRALARGAQASKGLRRGIGALTGADTRTTTEKAQAMLAELDINNPDDQDKILQIVSRVNPERAAVLKAQFAQQGRVRDEEGKAKTQEEAQRKGFADYLERTYPELDLRALVEAGTLNPQNLKDFLPALTKQGDRYKVVGSSVFDTATQTFMAGPAAKGDPKDDLMVVNNRLYSISAGDFITDVPTDESKKTEEMVTWEYIKGANDAKGIETPDFSTWRKNEADYSNRSPQRKVYDDLVRSAKGTGKEMPTYNDWFEAQKKADTKVVKTTNAETGVETSYLINSGTGNRIANLGVTGMPTLSIQKNDDGTYQLFNSATGSLGEPLETAASASIKQKKFYKTYAAIQELDATMGILGEAQNLRENEVAGGGVGYVLGKALPMTEARELASKVETIQANLAFDELEKMRTQSPNGSSGLGQVTEMELRLLKSSVSGLDPALGVEAFNRQVELIKQSYDRFKLALIGEGDYRVVDGEYFIKAPDGAIYNVGIVGGEL